MDIIQPVLEEKVSADTVEDEDTFKEMEDSDTLNANSVPKNSKIIYSLIAKLTESYDDNIATEICTLLDKYLLNPELLDAHYPAFIKLLLKIIENFTIEQQETVDSVFFIIYNICKVRGYKTIIKFFPVELKCLNFVLQLMNYCKKNVKFYVKYCTFLWLSILLLLPFDLTTIINMDDILHNICIPHLNDPSNVRIAVSILISSLLRINVDKDYYFLFFQYVSNCLNSDDTSNNNMNYLIYGIFETLTKILDNVSDDKNKLKIINSLPLILPKIRIIWQNASQSSLLRKLSIKLGTRIGLLYLNSKEIFQLLYKGLKSHDTIIRWSSAKGIGKISNHLNTESLEKITNSLIEFFNDPVEYSWQGVCLAFAELIRRKLLAISRLSALIPYICKALLYEVNKGSYNAGSNVRDAACYICWAIARSYIINNNDSDLDEYNLQLKNILGGTLCIVSCLDRDINCRRAAAAAFQEHAGRNNFFAFGVDIIDIVNFYSLSNITRCYLEISVSLVNKFPIYKMMFVEHILSVKLFHSDSNIRILSAKALAQYLKNEEDELIISKVISELLNKVLSPSVFERDGSLLGLSYVLRISLNSILPKDFQSSIYNKIIALEKERLYRGRGGEYVRKAVCILIQSFAISNFDLSVTQISRLMETINETMKNFLPNVSAEAITALELISNHYLKDSITASKLYSKTIEKYSNTLRIESIASITRSYALALGILPEHILSSQLNKIVDLLIEKTRIQYDSDLRDADTRKNSLISLVQIAKLFSSSEKIFEKSDILDEFKKPHFRLLPITKNIEISGKNIELFTFSIIGRICAACIYCFDDYCIENQGDVGSLVRIEAIKSSLSLLLILCSKIKNLADNNIVVELTHTFAIYIVQLIFKQSMEKLDRIRSISLDILQKIFFTHEDALKVAKIPHFEFIKTHLSTENSNIFSVFVNFLSTIYCPYILEGIISSVGGLSSQQVFKNSTEALVFFISENSKIEEQTNLYINLLFIMKKYAKNNRMIIPLLTTAGMIFSKNLLFYENFLVEFLDLLSKEVSKSTNIQKLGAAITIYVNLLHCEHFIIRKRSFSIILLFLVHKYPILRKKTADLLYEKIRNSETESDILIIPILENTCWLTESLEQLIRIVDNMKNINL